MPRLLLSSLLRRRFSRPLPFLAVHSVVPSRDAINKASVPLCIPILIIPMSCTLLMDEETMGNSVNM